MAHTRFRVSESGPPRRVGQGATALPQKFTAHCEGDDEGGPDVDLTFEVRNGVPECREVSIRATEAGHEVRVTGLAGIRVQDALAAAVLDLTRGRGDQNSDGLHRWYGDGRTDVRTVEAVRAARKVKITDDLLREVAEVYRANVKDRPTEAVRKHFDKAHRTAALYVARARERGYLNPALKGKAGEQDEEQHQ